MSRPPLPTHLKIVKGTAEKRRMNPKEPAPRKAMASSVKVLKSKGEKDAYKYLKSRIPEGVAFETDEPALVMAARLWHEMMTQDDFKVSTYTQLFTILGRFGMTPSDRQKVSVVEDKPKDAWEDL